MRMALNRCTNIIIIIIIIIVVVVVVVAIIIIIIILKSLDISCSQCAMPTVCKYAIIFLTL